MDAQTRKIVTEALVGRAAENPQFRQALLDDPRTAVKREFDMDVPPDIDLQVLEETPGKAYIILPLPAPTRDSTVTLREITETSVRAICALEVSPEQRGFVAPNAISIAEAHFNPKAWFRAIYAGETPVGFVMLLDDDETPRYFLWRYMVDSRYQGHGFGRKAMELVIDYVRTRPGAAQLVLSYIAGEGSPRDFYAGLGFAETGERHFGEILMGLPL